MRVQIQFFILFFLTTVLLSTCSSNSTVKSCQNDSDCNPDEICLSGLCTPKCLSNADCADGLVCLDGRCRPEADTGGLTDVTDDSGETADGSGGCNPPCGTGQGCNNETCEECSSAERCGVNCMVCPNDTPVCDGVAQGCICNADFCGDGRWCNNLACGECTVDGHCGSAVCAACGGETPRCDPNVRTCVECLSDNDCKETELCKNSSCVPVAFGWHTFYGSPVQDEGYSNSIAVNGDGNIYITGTSLHTWNGDFGQLPIHPHTDLGWDLWDIVVLKLLQRH